MTRVALVACSSKKAPVAVKARYLYQGNLFRLSVAWIERRSHVYRHWGILSAKHGLVLPDTVVEPYDMTLDSFTYDERLAWGRRTRQQLVDQWGAGTAYTLLCGAFYKYAVDGLPFTEDVFGHWARQRKDEGKRTRTGIGILMRELKNDRGYY